MLTAPKAVHEHDFDNLSADPDKGALVFAAAGCASCHNAPIAQGDDRLLLTGGKRFPSPFGTFIAPGLAFGDKGRHADWTLLDFANAVTQGVSPDGKHYFPALPYTTYQNMVPQDVADLFAYMRTLPVVDVTTEPHEVGFPFNIRRSLGGWKLINMRPGWHATPKDAQADEIFERGRYLVEALGHCGECHTPRNVIGAVKSSKWLRGAPNPSGKGTIPDLSPSALGWSEGDLVAFLRTGLTPDFDSTGGEMADVIDNMKQLPDEDLKAIARYLTSLP